MAIILACALDLAGMINLSCLLRLSGFCPRPFAMLVSSPLKLFPFLPEIFFVDLFALKSLGLSLGDLFHN